MERTARRRYVVSAANYIKASNALRSQLAPMRERSRRHEARMPKNPHHTYVIASAYVCVW